MKAECYVFDFAPDRSLKMIAETAKFANLTKKEKNHANTVSKEDDIARMEEFMNFFAVVSLEGGQMRAYDAESLFKQLDHVYIDRVVRNGFNDNMIYDTSYLMGLDDTQLKRLNELGGIIEKTTNMEKPKKAKSIELASNDLKDKAAKAKKKQREGKQLTPEERETLEAEKAARAEERKERENRISILRGIALRIPLLIYGAKVDDEEIGITINNLTERIDDASWVEFMPRGITKEIFEEIKPCFNAKMFALAGKRYRQLAREADTMHTDERVKRIAEIFSYFHNPDKETVLTPWRVVNMHMSDTLGGYCFFNEKFDGPNQKVVDGTGDALFDFIDTTEPRFVDRDKVTADVFGSKSKILEINSKTGLYPLYVTYSIYRQRMKDFAKHDLIDDIENYSIEEEQVIWDDIVKNNIYVICNTPMAARITERTLLGFRPISKENIKEDKLIEQAVSDREALIEKLQTVGYWNGTTDKTKMKFNAIVGNPPYQLIDGGDATSDAAAPIYQKFVGIAKDCSSTYVSMIMPSKWMIGGRSELSTFLSEMKEDVHLSKLIDIRNDRSLFETAHIDGGVCYFLWDKNKKTTDLEYKYILSNGISVYNNTLSNKYSQYVIRDSRVLPILDKIYFSYRSSSEIPENAKFSSIVSKTKPFGIRKDLFNNPEKYSSSVLSDTPFNNSLKIYGVKGKKGGAKRTSCYIDRASATDKYNAIDKYKIFFTTSYSSDAVVPPEEIRAKKNEICTETFLIIGPFESKEEMENCSAFINTKLFRFLLFLGHGTMQVNQSVFSLIPLITFNTKWTDELLAENFHLTSDDIKFIDKILEPK
jgi:hypothetical protein